MSTVIEMNQNPEQMLIDNLNQEINQLRQQIEQDKKNIRDEEDTSTKLTILEANESNRQIKKDMKEQKKSIDAKIK